MARTLKCDAIQDPDGSSPNISLTDAVTSFGTIEVDINDGNIDGCTINTSDITVGNSKTLNVQAGTLTTSTAQKNAILTGSTALTLSNSDQDVAVNNDLTVGNDLKVTGNTIKDSGGGNTIQMDGSNNVTVLGDLTVTGNDIATDSTMNFKPGGTSKMELQTDGDLVVTGDVTAFGTLSDEKMKNNIKDFQNPALALIAQMAVKTFTYKPDYQNHAVREGEQIGLIAQAVEKHIPQAVKTKEDGMKTIQYEVLVAILIKAIQEIYTNGLPSYEADSSN